MKLTTNPTKKGKLLIKKCHLCGTVMESYIERKKCTKCKKSFLPMNYFSKVHAKNSKEFDELFSNSDDMQEEDLIKGISVLW
jgi:uncharacterized OB-fold protein